MAVRASRSGATGHTAGIFADMTLDGPEIGTLVAVIDRARHLPNRKTMGKQDPYCAMRLGKEAKKTETDRRGGQTPKWDQELRFTVHDSPDYYKLKCSVFNDDKKTDLIGEAWIDLKEVIVPGGGQNDLWHSLQFKGKNAGEIRVEMTYYDSRPEDEASLEKKREKERRQLSRHNSPAGAASAAGARQLGPREVKRRPLPPGPGGAGPTTTPNSQVQSQPQPLNGSYPSQRDIPPLSHPLPLSSDHPLPQGHPSYDGRMDNHAPGYFPPGSPPTAEDRLPLYVPHSSDNNPEFMHPEDENTWSLDAQFHSSPQRPGYSIPPQGSHYQNPYDEQGWNDESLPRTPQSYHTQSYTPVSSSPLPWPSPASPASVAQAFDHQRPLPLNRHSVSPVKSASYRDSPLRHSVTHNDVSMDKHDTPDFYDEQDLPPPPPAHKGSLAQPVSTPPQPHVQQQPHFQRVQPPVQAKRPTVDDRSPLQTLERNYNPHFRLPFSAGMADPSTTSITYQAPSSAASYGQADYNDSFAFDAQYRSPSEHRNVTFSDVQQTVEQPSYGMRPRTQSNGYHGSYEPRDEAMSRGRPVPAHPPSQNEPFVYRSDPPLVRPRAISPTNPTAPPRKSVSPRPYSGETSVEIQGTPFSPDSYDVLNLGSSPETSIERQSAEQMKEAARLREVEKLREQGPIIGNDGRVIDPSDHLPSDTWAPEPERKTRKPEHVIRFKSKEETMRASRSGSSPSSVRPLSVAVPPHTSPTQQTDASVAASSPVRGGRNRLQKQMPPRQLPTQPFQHTHSSPTVSTMSQRETTYSSPSQSNQRPEYLKQSHYSTPSPRSGAPQPQTSEIPMARERGFSSSPKDVYSPGWQPRPERQFMYTGRDDYGTLRDVDPLSAEMSMIDIGPSRGGGRSAARFSSGYN